jgi:hypothetical protein
MPVILPPAPAVKMRFKGVMNGMNVSWAHFFAYGGTAPTVAQLNTWCGSIADTSGHPYKFYINSFFSHDFTLTEIDCIDLASVSGAVGAATYSVPGGDTFPAPTNAASVLTNWKIARRYRGGHPKTFWPPFGDDHITDARNWQAAQITSFASVLFPYLAAVEALGPVGSAPFSSVSISYFDKALVPTPPHVRPTPIIDSIIGENTGTLIATQRRRLR